MALIPSHLKNGKASNAAGALASVRADSYYELRAKHPKAFAIKASTDGFTGLVSVNSTDDFDIAKDEVHA